MAIIGEQKSATAVGNEALGTIRVLAFMEASSITGPAKNLIECAIQAKNAQGKGQRVQISIATYLRGNNSAPNAFIECARQAGIQVEVIRERHRFDLQVVRQIRSILSTVRPHIVQTHNVKSHFVVQLATRRDRYPWIAFHHGYTSVDWKDLLYRHFDRISLPAASHVITVCGAFASDLEAIGVPAERITIRHNMVRPFAPSPPDEVADIRSRLTLTSQELVLFSAGRLSREKAHVDLVEAVAQLPTSHSGRRFRVVIAGDGPERPKILALSKELGIADRVLLLGHQANLRPYYTIADVFVLPSHSEGSPNVLLEAMSAGAAVVATSVGGVPEIVADEHSALLVPKQNPAALSHAIHRLLINEDLRTRLGRHAIIQSRAYSPEAYYDAVAKTWGEAVKTSGVHNEESH